MRNFKEKAKLLSLICAIGVTLTASSCNKDKGDAPNTISNISVVNAVASSTALDFMIENQKVNSQAFKYGDIIDYFNAYSGTRTFNIYNRVNNSKIVSKSANLAHGKPYSVFVADTAIKASLIIVEDELARPATGKAKIRFVHLSPDTEKLDVTSGDSTLFSDKGYKEYTSFKAIEGDKTYSFKIKLKQTSTIKAALDNIEIKKNRIYTILIKGFSGKTDTYKLDAGIITNLE